MVKMVHEAWSHVIGGRREYGVGGGRKVWTVCDVPSWMAPKQPPQEILKNFNVSCSNVTMQGGDVMYLPFGTLHQATTFSDFSMHLTVNLERQFYVWQALFLAMIHKMLQPGLSIRKLKSSDDFQPDEYGLPLVALLAQLAASVPELCRLPGYSFYSFEAGASSPAFQPPQLLTSLSNEDLPEQYLGRLTQEFQDLAARLEAQAAAAKVGPVRVGSRVVSIVETLGELRKSDTAFPWALQFARFHSMEHSSLLAKPHQLQSLSTARSKNPESFTDLALSRFASTLPSSAVLRRAPDVRAVLLSEAEGAKAVETGTHQIQHKLVVNRQTLRLQTEEVPAALFCLGLFASKTSQGQPFNLRDVPLGSAKLLPKLLSFGALQLIS